MSHAISCPGCLKRFGWTPRIAGRRMTCHCGQKFIAPDSPGGEVVPIYETRPAEVARKQRPPDTYDLADEKPEKPENSKKSAKRSVAHANAEKCPSCNAPLKRDAVVCVRCGYNLAAGQRITTAVSQDQAPEPETAAPSNTPTKTAQTTQASSIGDPLAFGTSPIARALANRDDELKPSMMRERYAPFAMLSLGMIGLPAVSWWGTSSLAQATWHLLQYSGVAVLSILAVLGAVLGSLSLITIALGDFRSALFKIIAVGLLCSFAADLTTILITPMVLMAGIHGVIGLICIAITLNVVLVGAPLLYFFELDFQEVGIMLIFLIVLKAVGIPVTMVLAGSL